MEAFEAVVKVSLEEEGYVVTSGVKFPVLVTTRNGRTQTHGFEVDLLGARAGSLVLASVKSFFGSRGVGRHSFPGIARHEPGDEAKLYAMLLNPKVRDGIIDGAAKRYGYSTEQIELRLYGGHFTPGDETAIREHLGVLDVPVKVYSARDIMPGLVALSESRVYISDPVLMTLKALREAGILRNRSNGKTDGKGTVTANKANKANKRTLVPLTQRSVDAILAADPKRGRSAIARELGIPAAQVWAVRTAAGMTQVSADAVTYCLERVARAGVVIPFPIPLPKGDRSREQKRPA